MTASPPNAADCKTVGSSVRAAPPALDRARGAARLGAGADLSRGARRLRRAPRRVPLAEIDLADGPVACGDAASSSPSRASSTPLVNSLIAAGAHGGVLDRCSARRPATRSRATPSAGQNAYRLLVLLTRAFPLAILALPLTVSFIRFGLYDTPFGVSLDPHGAGAALRGPRHAEPVHGHPARIRGGGLGVRLHALPGLPEGGAAAGPAGPRGNRDLRLRDLLERGFRRLDPDGARADAHRLSADGPVRRARCTTASPAASS